MLNDINKENLQMAVKATESYMKKKKNNTLLGNVSKMILGDTTDNEIEMVQSPGTDISAIKISENTENWGDNTTIEMCGTNTGKDRVSLKAIDDQHSPMISLRTSIKGCGTPYIAFFPPSSTKEVPYLFIRPIAGVKNSGIVIGDNTYMPPPVSGIPITQISGGNLGERIYYIKYTYKTIKGETTPSAGSWDGKGYTVKSKYLFKAYIPRCYDPSVKYVCIYIGTSASTLKKQAEIAANTDSWGYWTEPTTGLINGQLIPTKNTTGNILLEINFSDDKPTIAFKAMAGVTKNFIEFKDSAGNIMSAINSKGRLAYYI